MFNNYKFTNGRPVTRSFITWYAFSFKGQELLDLKESFQIEHIYAKQRHIMENKLSDPSNLESLGNKILLEESINIRASDYQFEGKRKIYSGQERRGKNKESSKIAEIKQFSQQEKFDEQDIINRQNNIINKFIHNLKLENLID